MNTETIEAWHFLPSDGRLRYRDGRKPADGEWVGIPNEPRMCHHGMHACLDLLDAVRLGPGPILCRVELRGDIQHGKDKCVARERRILRREDVSKALHHYALVVAERALGWLEAGYRHPSLEWSLELKRACLEDGEDGRADRLAELMGASGRAHRHANSLHAKYLQAERRVRIAESDHGFAGRLISPSPTIRDVRNALCGAYLARAVVAAILGVNHPIEAAAQVEHYTAAGIRTLMLSDGDRAGMDKQERDWRRETLSRLIREHHQFDVCARP